MAGEKRYIVVEQTGLMPQVDSDSILQLVTRKKLPRLRAMAKRRRRSLNFRKAIEAIPNGVASRPAPQELIISLQTSSKSFWTTCAVSPTSDLKTDGKAFFDTMNAPEV